MTFQTRASGVLLHPTSLPGPFGIGEIGGEARSFLDALAGAGQTLWQVLPLGPTGYGDSPYQTFSSFAGNPLLIPFDDLRRDGLLEEGDLEGFPDLPRDRVDYGAVIPARTAVLRTVGRRFARRAPTALRRALAAFRKAHAGWLPDYALFAALKGEHGGQPWPLWEPELVRRDPAALAAARSRLADDIRDAEIQQFLFDRAWRDLRRRAHRLGIRLIGDVPIFAAHDSADTWANPGLFHLDDAGHPTVVAGVPPDYFSATGQLWGNPLYRWDAHAADGYSWWAARLRRTFDLCDIVRIDHFRGFEAYWEIPAGEPTAVNGRWVKGPGAALFEALHAALGPVRIVAEDLGLITPEVEALRDGLGLPGMKVLQFHIHDLLRDNDRDLESIPANAVVYTGTHDNDTTTGWFTAPPGPDDTRPPDAVERERQAIRDFLGTDGRDIHWDFIRLALRSPARMAVIPLQDVLGFGSEARMNRPGRPDGNWQWRMPSNPPDPEAFRRLEAETKASGR